MKLKNKINQEEFDALAEALQACYVKAGDAYTLDTEEATTLKRALETERRNAADAGKLLAQLVPEIADPATSTGFIDRKEWAAKVKSQADLLEELREDEFDLDTWRRVRTAGDDGKKPSELKQALTESQTRIRELERDLRTVTKDKEAAETSAATAVASAKTLAEAHEIDRVLDEIKVRDPRKRRLARLLLRDRGVEVRETGDKDNPFEVLTRDDSGAQVLFAEYAKDWAETEDGKEFTAAPDNSGGGDGGERQDDKQRPKRGTQEGWKELDPRSQIEAAFSGGARKSGARAATG